MRKLIFLFMLIVSYSSIFSQEGFSSFHSRNKFLFTSPGAMKYGLYGYDNPALLSYVDGLDMMFNWSNEIGKWNDLNNWGLYGAIPYLGFGVVHEKSDKYSITDYKLSTAIGDRNLSLGLGYGWSNGDENYFERTSIITAGLLIRPINYLSVGFVGTASTKSNSREGYLDAAFRPLGNELLTIFSDYSFRNKTRTSEKKQNWSAGVAAEIISGFRITGRYFETKEFSVGVNLGLGNIGLCSQAHYDKDGKYAYNTYGIRIGHYDRNIINAVCPPKKYYEMNLLGDVKYQRYKLFDNSNTLSSIIRQINAAKEDKNIYGIAINTSGMSATREVLWELRERLREFKSDGKKVIIFIDNPDLAVYHFASIADKIVMDPIGTVNLLGYVAGRTYYKNILENIGVGIDEHRFFKYKSAYENYSLNQMSEADKEQNQKLIDDFYGVVRKDVCESRNFSNEQFDKIVNEYGGLISQTALDLKLVDTLARWDSIPGIINRLEKDSYGAVSSLEKFKLPSDNYWGEPKKIAIIYVLGVCSMDEGITARQLVNDVEGALKDPDVKAIVLRVDSPGGDAKSSDYIADVIRKYKHIKPIIISQGSVAASGGYWLSMYGDTIVAAPNTITGSIGVISLWVYNKGLKEKLGLNTDYVKRGEHADLPFGMTVPLLGMSLPDRNLTKDERARLESYIKSMYEQFVNKVAEGRKLKSAYVDSIGQGRVWSGVEGKNNGLVDVLGGLDDAINIAREKAGIIKSEHLKIVEYPEPSWFDLDFIKPKLFGIEIKEDNSIQELKFRFQNIGNPLPILPLEEMDLIK